jgi:cytochrome c oxidase assembly factor 1
MRPLLRSLLSQPPTPRLSSKIRSFSQTTFRRNLIPAPTESSGPLLQRRAGRDLPELTHINNPWRTWRHMPLVAVILVAGGAAIMNYEKMNHSVVSSTMYALRVHPEARDKLGDEVYFAQRVPWIGGSIDQVHGVIDVNWGVKGKKTKGVMRFRATREKGDEFVRYFLGLLD